jgi:photosystem II stability/assembly factor-like uncharacterized protein
MSRPRLIRSLPFGLTALTLLSLPSAAELHAQRETGQTPPDQRLQWYEDHVAMKEPSLFKNLTWQFLGPLNISGRMTDVAVVEPKGQAYTIYVAGASGGVWKTVNEGVTWEPVFQHAASTSIGDVTLAPSDPDVVWVGTGEANIFRSSMAGAGVYKSTDAGKTWRHMGLAGTHTIPRIVVHPQNPAIVYVAASGHEWTNNEERGLYKSLDGGETWEKVLYVDEMTGVIDLVMDPSDPNTLYAATWQRVRQKWNDPRNEEHYRGSAIYRSSDGGATWEEVTNGLPEARHRGRIGIDLARSNPDVIYAFVDNYETLREAEEGETDSYGRPRGPVIKGATVYRSDDRGDSWSQTSETDEYMERLSGTYGWVFGQIRVDPNDEDRIYVMGLALNVSEDGGRTFRRLPGMHGDHHGLWIDPANSNYLVNVNDGGVAISYDGGENWRTFYDNLPLVQLFNVSYDMDDSFHVYGSIQDHGSRRGVVDLSQGRQRIPAVEWEDAPGGEGSRHAIDPTDPDIVYSAGFYGTIARSDISSEDQTTIVPTPEEGKPRFRGQWLAPFIISPHNPRVIYHGMNYLFRSMDQGSDWEQISPDLTHNDPDQLGDIPYQTIFAIAESSFDFGLVYVGTDDGRVHVTRDHGVNWTELTSRFPYRKWISSIAASAFDEATVYLTQNGKRDDDFAPYVWKSTDHGETWEDISAGIPSGPVNVIREDPKNPSVLYVGTDLGAYVSIDGGRDWHVLSGGLPTTFVHDIVIHPRDDIVVAATHGRGMWAMDARHIQKLTDEVLAKDLHLFETEAVRIVGRRFGGPAPGAGAHIFYYLKNGAEVSVLIRDASGDTVKELDGSGDRGVNVAIWDLTRDEEEEGQTGPVAPGTYTVVVTAGSASEEGTIEVIR